MSPVLVSLPRRSSASKEDSMRLIMWGAAYGVVLAVAVHVRIGTIEIPLP